MLPEDSAQHGDAKGVVQGGMKMLGRQDMSMLIREDQRHFFFSSLLLSSLELSDTTIYELEYELSSELLRHPEAGSSWPSWHEASH